MIVSWPNTMYPLERIENYKNTFDHPDNLFISGEMIVGMWVMGNSYKSGSSLYGAYPNTYLRRVAALFPEKKMPLHIFSGKVYSDANLKSDLSLYGPTVDINPAFHPTYLDDAQTLDKVPLEDFDIILADPPYSVEDSEHYKTSMVKRNKVLKALAARVKPGTHVVWLDQVFSMYRKDEWKILGLIGMVRSTNHRFRVVTIFERR